jgi:hypothetical protein
MQAMDVVYLRHDHMVYVCRRWMWFIYGMVMFTFTWLRIVGKFTTTTSLLPHLRALTMEIVPNKFLSPSLPLSPSSRPLLP